MPRDIPEPIFLHKLLRYEPDTGKLFWRKRDDVGTAWNTRYAGTEAFTASHEHGYKIGRICGNMYRAHRIIWVMYTGKNLDFQIDHINGNRSDNRIQNLRVSTQLQNMRNTKIRSDNKSGFKGVCWHKRAGKWAASIAVNRKTKHLGLFETREQAYDAYCLASLELHGDFRRVE